MVNHDRSKENGRVWVKDMWQNESQFGVTNWRDGRFQVNEEAEHNEHAQAGMPWEKERYRHGADSTQLISAGEQKSHVDEIP
jgi:hypothetical protein